jgi:hypothetical protein
MGLLRLLLLEAVAFEQIAFFVCHTGLAALAGYDGRIRQAGADA